MTANENIVQLSDTVMMEYGPVYKRAKATPKLLSDEMTASHYAVGQKDALGQEIVLGKDMTYVDWFGDKAWHVYQYVPMPDELATARGLAKGTLYWAQVAVKKTRAEAEAFASTLPK